MTKAAERVADHRYLVVSLGSIGRRHLGNLRALRPNGDIAALRLLNRAEDPAPPECDMLLASLEDVRTFAPDAAVIAAPASLHIEIADALLDMGIPLLVEKPFSDRLEGVAELVTKAEAQSIPLMIGYTLRFSPSLLSAREAILGGAIGDVLTAHAEVGQYLPDWRPGSDYRAGVSAQSLLGGGPLLELSHEIDYLYWFFGMPTHVTCQGGRYSELEIDVEDAIRLCLEYESPRRLVTINLDFLQRRPTRYCKFVGSHGSLTWDGIAGSIVIDRIDTAGDPVATPLSMGERNDLYMDELSHFLECVENGQKPSVDGRQGYDVMAIIEAARQSLLSRCSQRPAQFSGSA